MSAIFDLQSHCLTTSPPLSPGAFTSPESPPLSPGVIIVPASPGSPRSVSLTSADGRHDSDTDSSETEISDSDVFSEHSEVGHYYMYYNDTSIVFKCTIGGDDDMAMITMMIWQ